MTLRDESFDFVQRARIERPTQRDPVAALAFPAGRWRLVEQLAGEIEQRKVNARFANGLAGGKGRRDGAAHQNVDRFEVKRITAQQSDQSWKEPIRPFRNSSGASAHFAPNPWFRRPQ